MNNMDFKGSALGPSKFSQNKNKEVDEYKCATSSSMLTAKNMPRSLSLIDTSSLSHKQSKSKRTRAKRAPTKKGVLETRKARPASPPNNKLQMNHEYSPDSDRKRPSTPERERAELYAQWGNLYLDMDDLGDKDEINAEEAEPELKSLTPPPKVRPASPPNNKLQMDHEYSPGSYRKRPSPPERQRDEHSAPWGNLYWNIEDLRAENKMNAEGAKPELKSLTPPPDFLSDHQSEHLNYCKNDEELGMDLEKENYDDNDEEAKHGVMQKEDPAPLMNRSSVSPALSKFLKASGSHDVATSPALKSLEKSEEFSDSLKKYEEEEERHLMAESEERLKTLRQSLLAKRKEEEDRLKAESEEKLDKLRETLKTDQKRQEKNIRMEERHLKAEHEETLETLRQSLLTKRKEEEERLRKESVKKLKEFQESLQTDLENEEKIRKKEERRLKAEHEETLRTLRQSLLAKRKEEEDRLKAESEDKLDKLRKTLKTDQKRQEENIRMEKIRLKAEHEETLKTLRQSLLAKRRESEKNSEQLQATLKADLEKQEEKLRKEHKVSSREKLKQLETQLEEEFASEKESLQKNKDEQLNSYKQEIEEERKALMERDELLHQMNELQKVRQETEQNHQKEIVELREEHQSEMALLKEDLLSRFKKEKKQLLVSHTLDLQKMNDQHQAEIEKRQKENSEQESELQRCVDEVKLRITKLNRQEAILKASVENLDSRGTDFKIRESETDKVHSLIRERDMYQDELKRKREEKEQLYNKITAYKKKRNLQEAQLREERDIARQDRDIARQDRDIARQDRDIARQDSDIAKQDRDIAREELRKCKEQREAMETKLKFQKERYDSLNVRVSQLEEKSKDSRPVGEFSPAADMRPSSSSANSQLDVSLSLRNVESGYRTHTTSTNGWHESPLGKTNIPLPRPVDRLAGAQDKKASHGPPSLVCKR